MSAHTLESACAVGQGAVTCDFGDVQVLLTGRAAEWYVDVMTFLPDLLGVV